MRTLKILTIVLVGAAALLAVGLFALARYLESDTFRRAAIGAAQEALGAPVSVGELHVSIFSGATFGQVVVGNPGGVPGDLLRAEGLAVRPRLLPLLRRRLEIAEMRLDAPAVTLVRSEQGDWSFDRLVTRPAAPAGPGGAAASVEAPTTPAPASSTALDVVVPRLAVGRGTLAVTRERRGSLVAADGIEITTSLSRVAGALAGEGQLAVASLRVGERVEVRSLTAPLKFAGGDVTLVSIRGQLADGALEGQATVSLTGPTRYTVSLTLRDGRAEALMTTLGGRSG